MKQQTFLKRGAFLVIALFLLIHLANAQNKTFAIGTNTPNPNAVLQVDAPTGNQGILLPRLSSAQRTAMTLSATDKGMTVFDTDLNSTHTWNGSGWINDAIAPSSQIAQKIVLPYKDSLTMGAPVNTRLFTLKYNGTSDVGVTQFQNLYTGNTLPVISTLQRGTGYGGTFVVDNLNTDASAVYAEINSSEDSTAAYMGEVFGTGSMAGLFLISNATNSQPSVYAHSMGTGPALMGNSLNTGMAGYFVVESVSNTSPTLVAENKGLGAGGVFQINNASSNYPALIGETLGSGIAVQGRVPATSTGTAGHFQILNTGSSSSALYANTLGTGAAVHGVTSTGYASVFGQRNGTTNGFSGYFTNTNAANSYPAVQIETAGTNSSALNVSHNGSGGNLATFQNNYVNAARIDRTGQGFFNGGTQNSGADVAELFDVEGIKSEYEPGDVLVISESTDRTVEKSSTPNSTKVAGVFATKPGVTLTEKDINESTDDLVPMGVIGVIPTKVCFENGPIQRGDLLVTSSLTGHAMKAVSKNGDGVFPAGVILGKALENFSGPDRGIIKVLINVK